VLLTVGFLLTTFLGVAVTSAVFKRSSQSSVLLKLSLGIGVGLILSGVLYFVNLLVLPAYPYLYLGVEAVLVITLAIGGALEQRPSWPKPDLTTPAWLSAISLLSLSVSCWILWELFRQYPHGGWDAVAIWNLKARYLFAGPTVWQKRLFSHFLAHPDYPLGMPSIVASLWQVTEKDSTRAPFLVAVGFALATVGVLYSSLSALASRRNGFLALLILVSTPFFLSHSEAQYSDIPLSFLFLAATVLFAMHDTDETSTTPFVILAGAISGFAAWTKNEGLLFLALLAAVRFVIVLTRRGASTALKELLFYSLGAAPCLITLFFFKLQLAPSNDLISAGHSVDWLRNLLDAKRHYLILKAFGNQLLHFGLWLINPLPFLLLYIVLNRNSERLVKVARLTPVSLLAAMAIGYYIVYAIQPLDLPYLLDASLNRLLMQLWPLSLFCVFLRNSANRNLL
jgi:hypothetical protein